MAIKTSIIGNLKNIMSKWFYTEDEVNTLLNGKSDTNHNHDSRYYLKTEVDAIEDTLRLAIESLVGFTASIVETLPQTGSSGVMYLVPNDEGVEQDYYTEYIWTDEEKFEKIGNTAVEVDLSGYATISFVNSALADYVTSDELEGLLAGKADAVHSHSISDVSGLQSSLDGKAGNSVASSSANGLMSSTDKTKLDGIASGANKTVVDSALSSTSTNPVQNKVVKAELDSLNTTKANASHVHSRLNPTSIPENADLNDYTTQGSFYCASNFTAETIENIPSVMAFHLEVYRHAGVRQVFTSYHPDDVRTWERNYYNNNWSNWYQLYNQFNIDTALSESSIRPVQNKVVTSSINSLNSAKANTNHTHNDNSGIIEVNCTYGNVWKFKKNGWAVILWNDINLTNINKGAWTVIASTGWSNQAGATNHYGTFVTGNNNDNNQRFEVTTNGDLRVFKTTGSTVSIGYYGYIVYPTAD